MLLSVNTPDRQLIKEYEVEYVKLFTEDKGQITILDHHSDYVGVLGTGVVSFVGKKDKKNYLGVISTGFVKVAENHVQVLANTLELSDEIDLDRVILSKKTAEEMMRKIQHPEELEKYNRKLSRAAARLEVTNTKS